MNSINEDDLEWTEYDRGESTFRRKQLADAVDADDIGCSLYELPPGERSWPYHYHTANEEAVFVLDGEGVLRREDGEKPLEAGDYVALPANEDGSHQIRNESEKPLRYLMVSTMTEPDITIYPEMGKFGVFAGAPPGSRGERTFSGFYDLEDTVDYWEEDDER
ncbi:cupin domain-containing protein [Natrarchaeobius chitinivorans]|uniref:Cupin domain-containing protein n=1 Tax=Natrarchaeobius chitinivorans TaxID=1679083 RepID=A0A3N6LZV0_NATCH|nr:cupin domain-containing protein [Natrarchaeobius chitinivorans]RQG96473.1 cupin domain-containing protein [Natrarchaeobius chitinivorans]